MHRGNLMGTAFVFQKCCCVLNSNKYYAYRWLLKLCPVTIAPYTCCYWVLHLDPFNKSPDYYFKILLLRIGEMSKFSN